MKFAIGSAAATALITAFIVPVPAMAGNGDGGVTSQAGHQAGAFSPSP